MKLALRLLIVLLALAPMSAFADSRLNKMVESPDQHPTPAQGKALVVFLRSSFVGGAIASSVYRVAGDDQEFLGIVPNKSRVAVEVEPGQHRFMVIAENADFMEADLEAGKTYYALISPRMGVWKARFSLLPIHSDAANERNVQSKEFKEWLQETLRIEIGPEAESWYASKKAGIDKKRRKYVDKWNKQPEAHRSERTLRPQDGI